MFIICLSYLSCIENGFTLPWLIALYMGRTRRLQLKSTGSVGYVGFSYNLTFFVEEPCLKM